MDLKSRRTLDEDTISVVGICYTGLISANDYTDTIKCGTLGNTQQEIYYNPAVRLSERDNVPEQLVGKPIWLNHEGTHGEFGTIVDAWIGTTDEKMDRFVKAGNTPPESYVPDKRTVNIRALLDKKKLPYVYEKLGVDKPKDIALSVGYTYEHKQKGAVLQVTNKKLIEVSLCKLGYYQGCGICVQLSDGDDDKVLNWVQASSVSNIIVEDSAPTKTQKNIMSSTEIATETVPVTPTPAITASAPDSDVLSNQMKELLKAATDIGIDITNYNSVTALALNLIQDRAKVKAQHAERMQVPANEVLDILTSTLNCSISDEARTRFVNLARDDAPGCEEITRTIHKMAAQFKKSMEQPAPITASTPDPSIVESTAKIVSIKDAMVQNGVSGGGAVTASTPNINWMVKFAQSGVSIPKANKEDMIRAIRHDTRA